MDGKAPRSYPVHLVEVDQLGTSQLSISHIVFITHKARIDAPSRPQDTLFRLRGCTLTSHPLSS